MLGSIMYWTGVGSRETPPEIQQVMVDLGYTLADMGWVLRSGHAEGADSAFERGVQQWFMDNVEIHNIDDVEPPMEIYLPYNGFCGAKAEGIHYILPNEFNNYDVAKRIASRIHPAWNNCSDFAKNAHSRNVYQVLGMELKEPSKMLVCWAKPSNKFGNVQGGTGTAVALANECDIPVYNLYNEFTLNKILKFLEKHNVIPF